MMLTRNTIICQYINGCLKLITSEMCHRCMTQLFDQRYNKHNDFKFTIKIYMKKNIKECGMCIYNCILLSIVQGKIWKR